MQTIKQIDLGGVKSYLIQNGDSMVLVDTGGHLVLDKDFNDRYETLKSELTKLGVTAQNLKLILLTHGDNDHVCNAVALRDTYGARIAMSRKDLSLVEQPTLAECMKSFHYRSAMFRMVFHFMKKKIELVTLKTIREFTPFQPDLFLEDNDSLEEFGIDAKIIETPGHTDGSISILTKDHGLIAGDMYANNKKPELAPNAIDFKELKKSHEKLKAYGVQTVYPGHGNSFSFSDIK